HRFRAGRLLQAAALLMAATGLGFAGGASFWPLLVVAFVGTLNPSAGDVSVFLPLEHARLAGAARGEARTAMYARYSVLGALATPNPSGGDASWVRQLEHARQAGAARGEARTALYARYSVLGALAAALGALAAGVPDLLAAHAGIGRLATLRAMFGVYAAVGL